MSDKPKRPKKTLQEAMAERKAVRERKRRKATARRIKKEVDGRKVEIEMRRIERERARDRARKAIERQKKKAKELVADEAKRKELVTRILTKRRLVRFMERFVPNYDAGWVHHDVCARLEQFLKDVADKKSPRLMLFMPPRHGKSEIASKNFPAWALGHYPHFEIIASSYAASLPIGFSKKVRGLLEDPAYQATFEDTRLDPKSTSAEAWLTTAGGGYVAAGVGGGITGKGAHILIIDDPVKDAEEADSETQRNKVWDWYGSTAKTRLAPGGGILVIQTRWNDDDLSGRLVMQMQDTMKELEEQLSTSAEELEAALDREDEKEVQLATDRMTSLEEERAVIDSWDIVSYPALAERDEWLGKGNVVLSEGDFKEEVGEDDFRVEFVKAELSDSLAAGGKGHRRIRRKGEALHPARFPVGRLLNMKRSMQQRHWSALYQQKPVPDEGLYFRKSMFRLNPSPPILRDCKVFAAWDLAIGTRQVNDWTVGAIGALDFDDQLHVIDIIRAKMGDTDTIANAILDAVVKYNVQVTGMERGQLYLAVMPQLKKLMRKRRIHASFDESLVPITDKSIRARPLQGRMQQGMIDFSSLQPWFDDVQYELLRFPGGIHDDIVDALAWLVRMVMKHEPPRRQGPRRRKSWRDRLIAAGRNKNPMAS